MADNGKGFDTEKSKNEKNSQSKVRLGGIGLKNVDHRIELLCGKGYGINITSVPDEGTEVRIKVRERE